MEPIEWVVAGLVFVAAKVPDKAADKILDQLWDRGQNLLSQLQRKAPQTAAAIDQAQTTPLNLQQTVIEIEAIAQTDAEVAEAVEAVEATLREHPELQQKIATEIQSQPTVIQNNTKLAEKINTVIQGTTIKGGNVGNTGIVGSTIQGGTFNI
ncbi:MAG: hypothetical protein WBA77_07945 [Microcoleaceae cyanobacterium]